MFISLSLHVQLRPLPQLKSRAKAQVNPALGDACVLGAMMIAITLIVSTMMMDLFTVRVAVMKMKKIMVILFISSRGLGLWLVVAVAATVFRPADNRTHRFCF